MERDHVKILLVEDNEDHAELIRRGLEAQGVAGDEVLHVTNGLDALDYLHQRGSSTDRANRPLPELILLDLRLPKVSGLEVLREIKQSDATNRIPVVILTSSDSEKEKRAAYDLHANSYLSKPGEYGELIDLLGNVARYWLKCNSHCRK